ncbi:MAG: tetratricopeptide repeat protein, partial [Chlamydiia bacterium]|nr:tetratricopeptide repeat protein [Chlamydiia bacterium]
AEYGVILAYYLGDKHSSVIEAFEQSSLGQVQGSDFPAFEDLLLILEDCYERICEEGRAKQVLELLRSGDPDLAADLETSHALSSHSIELAAALARPLWQEDIADFRSSYCQCRLNPCTAQVLQGLLPGAGYWYVGQRQSGVTSFLVNLAFTAAAWHFFEQENWGAALFMTSMEFGWYVGGIYGAGLAAERWNENWYDCNMRPFLRDRSFTPALMLQFSF